MALRSYFLTLPSEPKLSKPDDVHRAIRGLKFSKVPSQKGIPNRAFKHFPQRAVSILAQFFNVVLRTHHFPQVWKHARVIAILKPGKNLALPSSYQHISLLDMISKLFQNILGKIFHVVSERGMMEDEQFQFRYRHNTFLQLARLLERITRNLGEKRLSGAVFLDVSKDFDTVWINGFLYKLPLLNFPSYIVHSISSYLTGRTFEGSFQTSSSRPGMRAEVAQGGLISHALTLATSQVGPLHGRHGSHIPQADSACQLLGVIPQ